MATRYPGSNMQELNLDWVLAKVKEMSDDTKELYNKAIVAEHTVETYESRLIALFTAIAPEFDENEDNDPMSFCWYDDVLYYLNDGHTSGDSWADTTHNQIDISNCLSFLLDITDTLDKNVSNIGDGVDILFATIAESPDIYTQPDLTIHTVYAIAKGTYFWYNGTLCYATAAISAGGQLIENTNYHVTRISDNLTRIDGHLDTLDNSVSDLSKEINFDIAKIGWASGTYGQNGVYSANTARIRTVRTFGKSTGELAVHALTGYEFALFGYTEEGVYSGQYCTDGTFKTSGGTLAWVTSFNFAGRSDSVTRFKLIARNATTPSAAITVSEATNIVFTCDTDDSLAISGVSADSKATGDRLNKLEVATGRPNFPLQMAATNAKWRLQLNGLASGTSLLCDLNRYTCKPGEKLYLKLNSVDNSAVCQFVSDYNLITSDTTKLIGDPIIGPFEGIVTVPEGAWYIAICQMQGASFEVGYYMDGKLVTNDLTIAVAYATSDEERANQMFADLSPTLNYLKEINRAENVKATIKLSASYQLSEQITVEGEDLSWISIVSDADEYVTVDCTNMSTVNLNVPAHSPYAAVNLKAVFAAVNGGVLPNICCLFKCSNANGHVGIGLYNHACAYIKDGCGVQCAHINLYLIEGAYANAMGAVFNHAVSSNINVFRTSSLIFGGGDATHAGYDGIYVDSNSNAEVSGADFSSSAENGIEVGPACLVQAQGTKADGCKIGCLAYNGGNVNGREFHATGCTTNALKAQTGARISLPSSTLTGCLARAVYAQTGAEIIIGGSDFSGATGVGCATEDGAIIRMPNANARKGVSDSTSDIQCGVGCIILAYGATGGTNKDPNVLTDSRLILK